MKKAEKKPVAPPEVSAEDREFELEVIKRNPTRKRIVRFDFPLEVNDARAVYLFEMTGRDELAAADMADANMTDVERKSFQRSMEAERRESIRLSIVALIVDVDGVTVRRHVDQAKPLMELDDWSMKAWAALRTFFGDINGIPVEELGNAVRGARKLGAASALPVAATQVVAGT